jgi:hypothetical protein
VIKEYGAVTGMVSHGLTEELGGNLLQFHFVPHTSYMT